MILFCGIQNDMNIQTKKTLDRRKSLTKNGTYNYYHVDPECIKQRHPHFHSGLLRVDSEIAEKLSKVHFDYLKLHFNVNLQL